MTVMDISVASSEARLDLEALPDPSAGGASGRAWQSIRETGRKLAAHVRLRPGPFSTVYRPFPVENGPFSLLSKLHHEIRTPLNAIIGFSELFLMHHRPISPDQARALVENVHASGQRLLAIMEALLGEGGAVINLAALHKEPVNVRYALHEIFRLLEPRISACRALCVPLADDDVCIEADRAAFRQMLLALLTCAIDRAGPDSLVLVAALRDKANTHVEFRCKDLVRGPSDDDSVAFAVVNTLALAHGGRLNIERDDATTFLAKLTFFATTAVQ